MANYSDELIEQVWKKGRKADGYDSDKYRLDAADAMMQRDQYGEEGLYGWEIDHIFPRAKLEQMGIEEELWDIIDNLRPMNAKNNASKGDDYPDYKSVLEFDFNKKFNIDSEVDRTISKSVQNKLNNLYGGKNEYVCHS